MNLSIENLKRYKDIAMLFVKHGRSDVVKQAGLDPILADEQEISEKDQEKAHELAEDLENLGGTYIKLGQLLSTRADLLPPAYLDALEKLQDDVKPFSFEKVNEIVCDELNVDISKAFSEFDEEPLAAASLGQVHKAKTRNGRPVVVKIQRPDIREQVAGDLDTLVGFAEKLDQHTEVGKKYEFGRILDELRKSILSELDYRKEASNLMTIAKNLKDFPNLVVPLPIDDYTTSRVLTMEYIPGKNVASLSPLARIDIDGKHLADELFRAYLKQILVDGFFHADPHPGNLSITKTGRIGLLDLGMVGHLQAEFRDNLLNLLLSISNGKGGEVAATAMKMGEPKDGFDEQEFTRLIGDLVAIEGTANLDKLNAGRIVLEITKIAADTAFRLPPEFTLIAKTLLNLDRAIYTLDPDFDPNKVIRSNAAKIMNERILETITPGAMMHNALEVKEFVEKLPHRINNILDVIGNNELQIKVDAIDEKTLMVAFQKIANRITTGLILAALIVAASLLMRVESSFEILGYPALPLLFFVFAAVGGIILIVNIIINDRKLQEDNSK